MSDKPVDFECITDGSTLKALRKAQRFAMVLHYAGKRWPAKYREYFDRNMIGYEHTARTWHDLFGGILCKHGWFDPMQCDDCVLRAIDSTFEGDHDRCELLIREFWPISRWWDAESNDLIDFVEEGGGK